MEALLLETGGDEESVAVYSMFLWETYLSAVPFSSPGIKLRPAEKALYDSMFIIIAAR